ncbi:threonine ammonia-lyase [Acuticoccus sp.]|uniref:threonine ammonia-lyase n=1 Tax=Acuticoccus sp. TaxID=1904378 RepID=UPI003B517ADE
MPVPSAADAAPFAIELSDVEAAARRLAGVAVRTPLITSAILDERCGARVFVKAECLQRTGSFKFRGATNAIARIAEGARARGVVASSSGNHAQGVAEAARLASIPATIVMPDDAPAIKRARTERSGATVVACDRERDDREAIAEALAERLGATIVPPYDDPGVMAGQGTVGLEIADELDGLGIVADRVLVPTSGGGLLSGVATVMAGRMPSAICQPAEPEGFDDMSRSLAAGERLDNASRSGSIADALLSRRPGTLTFPIIARHARPGVAVPDEWLLRAVAFAFTELKLSAEPGGAVALAALLSGRLDVAGETVVVVLSGGNVDPGILAQALAMDAPTYPQSMGSGGISVAPS